MNRDPENKFVKGKKTRTRGRPAGTGSVQRDNELFRDAVKTGHIKEYYQMLYDAWTQNDNIIHKQWAAERWENRVFGKNPERLNIQQSTETLFEKLGINESIQNQTEQSGETD